MEKLNEITDGRILRSAKTRQKLLKAANKEFLEKGFKNTTIKNIIKEANTGYGTAYAHFTGKDDILVVLIEDLMESFFEIAGTTFSPETTEEAEKIILTQVLSFLKLSESEQNIMKVISEAMGLSETINYKWEEIRQNFIESIIKDIRYSQSKGLARTQIKPELVARMWYYSNEMYQWDIVHNRNVATLDDIANALTDVYINGLYFRVED